MKKGVFKVAMVGAVVAGITGGVFADSQMKAVEVMPAEMIEIEFISSAVNHTEAIKPAEATEFDFLPADPGSENNMVISEGLGDIEVKELERAIETFKIIDELD
jgi:hypothetical protein